VPVAAPDSARAAAPPAPGPAPAPGLDARGPARARARAPSARRVDGVVRWLDAQRLAAPVRTAAALPAALASGELLCALVRRAVPAARLAPVHRRPLARTLRAANAENALGVLWRGGRCRGGVLRAYGAAGGDAPAAAAAAALVCEVFDAYSVRDLRRREADITRRVDAALVARGAPRLARPVTWARAFRDGVRLLVLAGPGADHADDPVAAAFATLRRRRVPLLWETPRAFRARADDDLVLAQLDLLVYPVLTRGCPGAPPRSSPVAVEGPAPHTTRRCHPARDLPKRAQTGPPPAGDPEDGQWELFRHRLLARRAAGLSRERRVQ